MKRSIPAPKGPVAQKGDRLYQIFDGLRTLGFNGGDWAEDRVNSVLEKLHETEEQRDAESSRADVNARLVEQKDKALGRAIWDIENLKSIIETLKAARENQYRTIRNFQNYTGKSEVIERREVNRRGKDTWLITGEVTTAIKALGAISPRTDAQTQALRELISSVRLDGSSNFRTPGFDRRKK